VSTTELTAARLRRPGPGGARVLLIAGRTWLDTAGSPDEHRVPVRLLDRLWLSTRRGIELDVVCGVDRVLRLLDTFGEGWNLRDYDAVVLLPDIGRSAMGSRLQRVLLRMAGITRVLRVTADQEVAEVGPIGSGWTEVRFPHVQGACPAAVVAEAVSGALVDVLERTRLPRHAAPHVDTVADHLRRIATLAASAFAVQSSAIAVTRGGRPRTLAAVGPLDGPPCPRAAVAPSPTLVLDTWRDERFIGDPRLGDRDQVRFFAAHPLEGTDGRAIGTISVSDALPRAADEFDADVLRDLAVLASAEIQYAGALV
jgi:hypothetical protein